MREEYCRTNLQKLVENGCITQRTANEIELCEQVRERAPDLSEASDKALLPLAGEMTERQENEVLRRARQVQKKNGKLIYKDTKEIVKDVKRIPNIRKTSDSEEELGIGELAVKMKAVEINNRARDNLVGEFRELIQLAHVHNQTYEYIRKSFNKAMKAVKTLDKTGKD